jgi:leucyl aminopeptidase
MWDMKYDRAGAAAVVGAMVALARKQVPVDVVAVLGLVENMPSGSAQRPGDVVTSHSGQTIEVLHTDAEGRLLLADLLSYARSRFSPAAILDIATLTGGLTSVLTDRYAGLYANDEVLASALADAGEACGERIWRLPLNDAFDRMIDSPVADMQNICKQRWGGTATAAQFLKRFVGDTPWAHLDIFGPAWNHGASGPHGATGYGVRLLTGLADVWSRRSVA